jgi:peptide/nickel transport system permease protein
MTTYVIRRLLGIVPTLLVVLFLVVLLVRIIPGSIIDLMLGEQVRATSLDRQAVEQRLGIDKPLVYQYADYVSGAVQGDLGKSLWTRRSVREMILERLPVTLELSGLALLMSTTVGICGGVLAAIRQGSPLDYLLRTVSVVVLSVPSFAIGTLAVVIPAIYWGWTPPLFYTRLSEDPWGHISQFFVPAAVLGLAVSAGVMRLTRTLTLEVLRQDYVRTAWSKGLSERLVVFRHVARNAMIPVVTVLGLQVAGAMSGSVIMEQIFGLPGMGNLLIESISARDYPVVQAVTLVIGMWVILVNLIIDLSYAYLDPRVRVGRRGV